MNERIIRTMVWHMSFVSISYMSLITGVRILGAQQPMVSAHSTVDASKSLDELLARPVTITLTNVSLKRAVDSVAHVAKVVIQYQVGALQSQTAPVTLHAAKMPLGIVLEHVLDGTALRVVSDGEGALAIVSLTRSRTDSIPKTGVVTGRVVDSATGRGLRGATIKVAGTKLSLLSADSGRFTIHDIPAGDQLLTVRLFGYRMATRTVTVSDNTPAFVRVALTTVPTVLSGVVTTATGIQRKVEVGNDITTLNVDSVMRVAPINSVTDLLETRVPGLTVLHTSGVPGDPSRIRLRGASSINENNDPIVIVDGVRVYASQSDQRNDNLAPAQTGGSGLGHFSGSGNGSKAYAAPSPLDQIDPNSIETIEVFKGPSASALYGSDAANGVIVITTKRGRAGPTHWDLTLGQGVNWLPGSWPVNYYPFGSDVIDYSRDFYTVGLCVWSDPDCHIDSLVAFQALNDPRYTVFSHGSNQTANLTIAGGVPSLTYNLTGSAATNGGYLKLPEIEQQRYEKFYGPIPHYLLRPDHLTTWGANGTLTAQPNAAVQVTLLSSLYNTTQQRSSLEQAILQLDGEYVDPTQLNHASLIQNDVERATAGSLTSTNALTLTWQLRPEFALTAAGGLNTIQRNDETLIPFGVNSCSEGGAGAINDALCLVNVDTTGSYGLGRGTSQVKTLNIGTSIPERIITLGIGANLNAQSTADFSAYTNQLSPGVTKPTVFPTTLVNGSSPSSFSQNTTAWSTYGWFVEPRLNVASKFFVSPGFRLDGGSASGSNAGLTSFPKINLSYIAVDQDRPWGILTALRPRLSFGYAGTQPNPTDKLRLFNASGTSTSVTLDDSTFLSLVQLSTLGNTQLRPERSSELEGGFDVDFFNARIRMTYTLNNKTRHDAIVAIPVPPSVAGGTGALIQANIGEIRETGTEITMDAQVLQGRALSWTVGGNLTNSNNRVIRLNQGFVPDKVVGVVPGYPLFSEWVSPIVSFADANHDGIIEPSEIRYGDSAVFVGQPNAKYQLNLYTNIILLNGRLSLNATASYQDGLTQNNAGAASSGAFALLPNIPGTSLATQAAVVAAGNGGGPSPIGLIQTVNILRFNDLSINYQVPPRVSTFFRVPRMTLAVQGSNLGLHTNYRGKDPSVNAFSTVSTGDETEDVGQIPQPRTWWLKLSMGN